MEPDRAQTIAARDQLWASLRLLRSEIDQLAHFWDEVNREDIAIVERVQEGLGARAYTGGRMCYRFEEPLHRFQNMVIDRMVGIRRVPSGDSAERMPMFAAQTPA